MLNDRHYPYGPITSNASSDGTQKNISYSSPSKTTVIPKNENPLFVKLPGHDINSFYEVMSCMTNVFNDTQVRLRSLKDGTELPGTYSTTKLIQVDFEFGFSTNIPNIGERFVFQQVKFLEKKPAIERVETSNVESVFELHSGSTFVTYAVTTQHSLYIVQVRK